MIKMDFDSVPIRKTCQNKYSSSVVNNHHSNINKICCPIHKKSADKIVEDRTCSILADKIGQFLHDTRQIFDGRFCRQIKSADFVVHLTSLSKFKLTTTKQQHTPSYALTAYWIVIKKHANVTLINLHLTAKHDTCDNYFNHEIYITHYRIM